MSISDTEARIALDALKNLGDPEEVQLYTFPWASDGIYLNEQQLKDIRDAWGDGFSVPSTKWHIGDKS